MDSKLVKYLTMAVIVAVIVTVLGLIVINSAQAQTTTTLYIATDPPATYCAVSGNTVTLGTTWWDGDKLNANDSLSLPREHGTSWQCTGNYTAGISWAVPGSSFGSCQGIAIANDSILAACNGNSCSPNDKSTDYTISWNNSSCAN